MPTRVEARKRECLQQRKRLSKYGHVKYDENGAPVLSLSPYMSSRALLLSSSAQTIPFAGACETVGTVDHVITPALDSASMGLLKPCWNSLVNTNWRAIFEQKHPNRSSSRNRRAEPARAEDSTVTVARYPNYLPDRTQWKEKHFRATRTKSTLNLTFRPLVIIPGAIAPGCIASPTAPPRPSSGGRKRVREEHKERPMTAHLHPSVPDTATSPLVSPAPGMSMSTSYAGINMMHRSFSGEKRATLLASTSESVIAPHSIPRSPTGKTFRPAAAHGKRIPGLTSSASGGPVNPFPRPPLMPARVSSAPDRPMEVEVTVSASSPMTSAQETGAPLARVLSAMNNTSMRDGEESGLPRCEVSFLDMTRARIRGTWLSALCCVRMLHCLVRL